MTCCCVITRWVFALAVLGATGAGAQGVISKPDTTISQEGSGPRAGNLPDACKLMLQSDLEALFPGRPILSKPPMLSPVYKGPQYPEVCTFEIKLPNPLYKTDDTKLASIHIISWGGQTDGPSGTASSFANYRASAERAASDPKLKIRWELLPGLGDEAFVEYRAGRYEVVVRKGDLIFIVNLDEYNAQSQPNAIALATQAAKRWKIGVGMVAAATPITANSTVDIPEDTRAPSVAPPEKWPDACALLTPEDVRSVFGDMKIEGPRKMRGQIEFMSRVDRTVELPNPIRCEYQANRTDLVNGQRQYIFHWVDLKVSNVAATPELSRKFYDMTRKGGDAKTEVGGLGDEASINIMNAMYIRKGLLTVELHVGGGGRDKAIYDDATRRLKEIAKLVVAKFP